MDNIFDVLRKKSVTLFKQYSLLDHPVVIQARELSTQEAIGNPESEDFPLHKGKERLMQAEFGNGTGQAFTDRFGDFEGKLADILAMPLENNYRRSVFIATLNAVIHHLNLIDRTIHCRDKEPGQCADELVSYIKNRYGNIKITQIGFQPRMVENLAAKFDYRIMDLDADNIGSNKFGVRIEGPESASDAIDWADLLLVTGSTLTNNTISDFLDKKQVLFYGTTIAGAAYLMGWDRFCAKSR